MGKTLVIIDGDGLTFQASKETLNESIEILDNKIENILEKTNADSYLLFLSFGKYFRHHLNPEYKSNRKKRPTDLLWPSILKQYMVKKWKGVNVDSVEADDLCALFMSATIIDEDESPYNMILSSPDKDLLKSIPGKHFNYSWFLKDKENIDSLVKGSWIETSKDDTKLFLKSQMVIGDTSDGIKGIEGKGEKYWDKLVSEKKTSYPHILNEYIDKYGEYKGIINFQRNFRSLHILSKLDHFESECPEVIEKLDTIIPVNVDKEEVKTNENISEEDF